MTSRTFGRKGQGESQELARRREAFIAKERERSVQQEEPATAAIRPAFGSGGGHRPPMAGTSSVHGVPIIVREKSMGAAYLFWFFFGALSAHRFYLGYPVSAVCQAGLWMTGWMLALSGAVVALPILAIFALWVLADAFLIPGLTRGANARAREVASAYVFT